MNFETKIVYDNDMTHALIENNMVGEVIKWRGLLVNNNELEIPYSKLEAIYSNKPYIWARTQGISKDKIKLDDNGVIWYHTPMRAREARCKFGSRFIIDIGTCGLGYWISSPKIMESINFVDNPKNIENNDTKEFKRASIIVQNTIKAPFTALINILQPRTKIKLTVMGNDLAFGRKKFCGADEHVNKSGLYQAIGINYSYDDDFFKKILTEDEYHRSTRAGITGISNIIPNYSREEFTEEFTSEVKRLVNIAEDLMND